jgi:hypothetical protein
MKKELTRRFRPATCITFVVGLSIILASSLVAEAQTAPGGQREGALPVGHIGQRVWVTTADGSEVTGTLLSLTEARLVVRGNGADTPIPLGDVRRIVAQTSRGNGVRNGAIAGALIFGAVSKPLGHAYCAETSRDRYDARGCAQSNSLVLFMVGGAFVGGAFGALADHSSVGRDVIYSAKPAAPTVHVTPLLAPTRAGIGVSISWR